jgi:hypothetical protein
VVAVQTRNIRATGRHDGCGRVQSAPSPCPHPRPQPGGHSARQLYSDGEEFTFSVKRPVILNGIDDVASKPDLAERALQIELEEIPNDRRITEKELWLSLDTAGPVIFSGILNGLVCALREQPQLKMDSLPRMADAAKWATAGETAFGWPQGTFIAAYSQSR